MAGDGIWPRWQMLFWGSMGAWPKKMLRGRPDGAAGNSGMLSEHTPLPADDSRITPPGSASPARARGSLCRYHYIGMRAAAHASCTIIVAGSVESVGAGSVLVLLVEERERVVIIARADAVHMDGPVYVFSSFIICISVSVSLRISLSFASLSLSLSLPRSSPV